MTFRPLFPNHARDLAPELACVAVFIIAIGPGPDADSRSDADKSVPGCEGSHCILPAREGERDIGAAR
jgi:hypothetical protein